jgi:GH25 family lysozyme M1 (1,4-beta-N-acetylmuramidase)
MYAFASNVNSADYSSISNYPLWIASYLYRYDGAGWVDNPDNT